MRYLPLIFCLIGHFVFADTPPQFINKQCGTHQWFSQIQPGVGNINCTQPLYSDIGGTFPNTALWSQITGTLSNQTDLQSALNAKQNTLTLGNLISGTGALSVTGGAGAVIGSGVSLSIATSTNSVTGLLSAADHTTFSNAVSGLAPIVTVTTSSSIPVGQIYTDANCASACTITLPAASSVYNGSGTVRYAIKNIGSGIPTITAAGSDLIDGAATFPLTFQESNLDITATSYGWDIR